MLPKISIVTVNLNNCEGLEKTIKSVVQQTYKFNEFIIIDGGSKDGSVDIIHRYERKISRWISEEDRGIYDAMNKGIDLVTGDWVIFMNSGDAFCKQDVIERLFSRAISERYSVVYGNVCLCFQRGNIIRDLSPKEGQIPSFCHQSMFVRTDKLKKRKFDLRFAICADYDFAYSLYELGAEFLHVNLTVADYDMGGISARRLDLYYKEISTIEGNYSKIEMIRQIIKTRLRSVLPVLFDFLFYWVMKYRKSK